MRGNIHVILLIGLGWAQLGWSAIHRWDEEVELFGKLPGHQSNPAMALGPSGGYAVWQNVTAKSNGDRVVIHQIDGLLAGRGGPVRLTSDRGRSNETNPRVALLAGGGAVVVWESGSRTDRDVMIRFIDASGQPAGDVAVVNGFKRGNQTQPDVTVNSSGEVLVVWQSYGQDGDGLGIYAQRYTSQGLRLGGEIQITEAFRMNQSQPTCAALNDGRRIVAWIGEVSHGLTQAGTPFIRSNVMGRLINSRGQTVGNEFRLDDGQALCARPRAVAARGGGFAIGWAQRDEISMFNMWNIYFRKFSRDGLPEGKIVRQNKYTKEMQKHFAMAQLDDEILMVWDCGTVDNAGSEVHGRLLDGGAEFRVNTKTALQQWMATAAGDGNGRGLVVWVDVVSSDNTTLRAQKVSNRGRGPDLAAGPDVVGGPIGQKRYPLVMRVDEKLSLPGTKMDRERDELKQKAVIKHENAVQEAAQIAQRAAAKSAVRSLRNNARLAGASNGGSSVPKNSSGQTVALATRQKAAKTAPVLPRPSGTRARRPVVMGVRQTRVAMAPTEPTPMIPATPKPSPQPQGNTVSKKQPVSSAAPVRPPSMRLVTPAGPSRISLAAQSTLRNRAAIASTRQTRSMRLATPSGLSTAQRIAAHSRQINRAQLGGSTRLQPARPANTQLAAHRAMQQYAQRRTAMAHAGNRMSTRSMPTAAPRTVMINRAMPGRTVQAGGGSVAMNRANAMRANAMARQNEAQRSRSIPVPATLERAGGRTNIRFNSESGRRYMLQSSPDRNNWRNAGTVYHGDGRSMAIPVNTPPGQRFIRVVPTD